ncbi:radical SAM protein [Azospirillum sp. BE72]|uniref:radical SAM protein n=1 Tax=Azospirillum sp. BE72 TaxID=2817776 RepID=UPI002863996B|nr:radical SAM protein [Azospirillum sp. BE72]MDR6774846.1 MoaA/NifB/PqqE/SkfB family radical SAM enzyme [Azospirillum sp. BE72]
MKILSIHMYLTPACNLSCTHCYYEAFKPGEPSGSVLSTDDCISIISWLCRCFDADLHLEGGELFLRPDIDDILAALPPAALKALTLTTSGTVPIKVRPDILRALGELRISIEGHTDELQSALRPAKLAPVFRTMEGLKANEVPFTVRTTLHRANAGHLREMLETFAGRGAGSISLFEFQAVGRGASEMGHMLEDSAFEAVLDELAANSPDPRVNLKLSLSPRRIPMALERRAELEARGFRYVDLRGIPNLTINSNGDIGVSPWKVTARQVHDRFTTVFEPDFRVKVERRLADQAAEPPCPHTSGLLLRYVAPGA